MIEVLQSWPKITAMDLFDVDLPIFPTVILILIDFSNITNQPLLI